MNNGKKIRISILVIFLFLCFYLTHSSPIKGLEISSETTFFVSNTGNDNNNGTINNPFLTLEGARNAVRRLKGSRKLAKGNIVVYIRGGVYYRDKSFSLDSTDSATANSPILYKAYNNEKVTITGGINLDSTKFVKVTDNNILNRIIDKNARNYIYKYDLSTSNIDYASNSKDITEVPELFYNNQPLTPARWPNNDYVYTGPIISNNDSNYIFKFKEDRELLWKDTNDIWLSGYWNHNWADSTVKLGFMDISNKQFIINQNIPYGMRENQRYFVFNLLEELDMPGEYCIDKANKKIYIYPPSSINKSSIYLSQLKVPFITMNNTSYVTIEGLNFESGRNIAITINGGQNNVIACCTIRNISKDAVTINGGNYNGVQSCSIYNTGAGGVLITAGDRDKLVAANNYADNNEIYNYARIRKTYFPAIKLDGVGIRASHNDIHDAPHQAIQFEGNDNIIEYNKIYDIAQDTDDVGAIYAWQDWTFRGNILRYNYIYDIISTNDKISKVGKVGIYLDASVSGDEIYGNIFRNVDRAMLIDDGRDHVISNNLIINCKLSSIYFGERGFTESSNQLYNNLSKVPYQSNIWKTKYPKLYAMSNDPNPGIPSGNTVTKNAIYNSAVPNIVPSVIKYGIVSKNNILSSADYITLKAYLDSEGGISVRLPIKSFKTIPVSKIGIYKDKYR